MSDLNLVTAHTQWRNRPPDERFASLPEMHEACLKYKNLSEVKFHPLSKLNLHADSDSNEIMLDIDEVGETRFTNWGFNQIAQMAEFPPSSLRKLPARLAVECLSYCLDKNSNEFYQLLIHNGENKLCRAITTPSYKRIYNADVTNKLLGLLDYGWRVPPARPAFPFQEGTRKATLEDVLDMETFSLSVKVGDSIAPAGLYASDHDLFVFMINPDKYIEDGSGNPLYRGFFVWNSEVGGATLGIQTFLFRHVCSNHIVWGASEVKSFKIRHIGKAEFKFRDDLQPKLLEYSNASFSIEEELIKSAQAKRLGKDKEEVVDTILSKRIKIGKKLLGEAYEETETNPEDGDPTSLYGMINGLTRLSQNTNYADDRTNLDRTAGELFNFVK